MTWQQFLSNQGHFAPDFVDRVFHEAKQQRSKYDEYTEAIICGINNGVPDLYRIDRHTRAHCQNAAGFTAIGEGEWHALSQFMFYNYTRAWSFPNALHLIYSAKRRAEVAPTVGSESDFFFIQQTFTQLDDELMSEIGRSYVRMVAQQNGAVAQSATEVEKILHEVIGRQAQQYRQPPPPTEEASEPKPEEPPPESPSDA